MMTEEFFLHKKVLFLDSHDYCSYRLEQVTKEKSSQDCHRERGCDVLTLGLEYLLVPVSPCCLYLL